MHKIEVKERMKFIIVTGGAGFVGSHLISKLLVQGYKVISIDNYSSGSYSNHRYGATYIQGHCRDISEHLAQHPSPDLIFHLGEYSRVETSFQNIAQVMDYNLDHTTAVFEYARLNGSKLVYAGSSTKFADHPGYIKSPYAWTKEVNTERAMLYKEWFDLNVAVTYFYNVYGPGEISSGSYSTLIGKYREAMLTGEKLNVVEPGTQLRNFTHVDDIVAGLLLVGEEGSGDEYGIGADEAYSVLEVASMFGGETVMLPPRRGNRMSAPVITSKLKSLGWSAKHRLPEYIETLRSREWKQ